MMMLLNDCISQVRPIFQTVASGHAAELGQAANHSLMSRKTAQHAGGKFAAEQRPNKRAFHVEFHADVLFRGLLLPRSS